MGNMRNVRLFVVRPSTILIIITLCFIGANAWNGQRTAPQREMNFYYENGRDEGEIIIYEKSESEGVAQSLSPSHEYNQFYTIGDHDKDISLMVSFHVDSEKLRVEFEQTLPASDPLHPLHKHYTRDSDLTLRKEGDLSQDVYFQVFLRFGNQKGYYQFIVNQENTQFDLFNRSVTKHDVRMDFDWFSAVTVLDSLHWKGEVEIPWQSLYQDNWEGLLIRSLSELQKRKKMKKRRYSRMNRYIPPFKQEKPSSIMQSLHINVCATYLKEGQQQSISIAPLSESVHEPGNFLLLRLPKPVKIEPYSGKLIPIHEQILEQLIRYDGEEFVDRKRSVRDLMRRISQEFDLEKNRDLFNKYQIERIPLDVLKMMLNRIGNAFSEEQNDKFVGWLKELSEKTEEPRRKVIIIDLMNSVKSRQIAAARRKHQQQIYSDGKEIPLYYLGLITKETQTPMNVLKFGTIVFPLDSAGVIYTRLGESSWSKTFPSGEEIKCKTMDGQIIQIPSSNLIVLPAKGKSLSDSLTLYSLVDNQFEISRKVKLSQQQTLLVTSYTTDSGGKDWYQVTSRLIGEYYGKLESAWVPKEDFTLDTNYIYVGALSEWSHKEGTPWDFLEDAKQLDSTYKLAIQGRNIHDADLIGMTFRYTEKLIRLEDYKRVEQILMPIIHDDIELLRTERDEYYSSSYPASIHSRYKLIELYGKHTKEFEKLKEIAISTVREYQGLPISGFEWNSFAGHSAISRAIRYLKKDDGYYQFLTKLSEVSTYDFTSAYLELLMGDYYLGKGDYKAALEKYMQIIQHFPAESNVFFKTEVNYHSQAIARFIWVKLIDDVPITQIHDDLFSILPETLDKEKYEIGFRKMMATYLPVNPIVLSRKEIREDDKRQFTFGGFGSKIPGAVWVNWLSAFRDATLIDTITSLRELPVDDAKDIMTLYPGQKVISLFSEHWSSYFSGWVKVKLMGEETYGWIRDDSIRKIRVPRISSGFLYRFPRGHEPQYVSFVKGGQIVHETEMIAPPRNVHGDQSPLFFLIPESLMEREPMILSLHYNEEEQLSLFESYDYTDMTSTLPDDFFNTLKAEFPKKVRDTQKVEELYQKLSKDYERAERSVESYLHVYSDDFDGDGSIDWIIELKDGVTLEKYLLFFLRDRLDIFEDSHIVQAFRLNSIIHFEAQWTNYGKICINVYACYPSIVSRVYSDNCVYDVEFKD